MTNYDGIVGDLHKKVKGIREHIFLLMVQIFFERVDAFKEILFVSFSYNLTFLVTENRTHGISIFTGLAD